jgi:Tfp pilus assembly protein PilX
MRYQQRGFMLPFVVLAVAGVVLLFVSSMQSSATYSQLASENTDREAVVSAASASLSSWYNAESDTIELASSAEAEAQLLTRVSDRRFGLRMAMSQQLGLPCSVGATLVSCVPYRRFAVWLPAVSDASTASFDPGTGAFTAGNSIVSRVVDTRALQMDKAQKAVDRMQAVAGSIQRFAQARSAALPYGSGRTNFLRAQRCVAVEIAELPCVDTYTDLVSSGVAGLVGLSASDVVSEFGGTVMFSNLQDSNSTLPPYSASIQVSTPWGTSLKVAVVQGF